ncbi:type VI secretion system contractile sheath domain-containing protein [Motiliproteus sp. MSK22-1]|uniref:type VI secretion system contractile sheath domain-containing protein n=1 Tax=Motiliproteus sp. MSK22-1 TaxID=1897630 RepID=UPI0009766B57|nr:type VI secretion system contractile sheath large subunit [Motiliproteus sp. MSK22-1]OMH39403.1 hypothetical protein BGP75_03590 [Motiliproteus sp. MSK22-1]
MELEFSFRTRSSGAARSPGDVVKVLLMGDFSGQRLAGTSVAETLATETSESDLNPVLLKVDVDNFDQRMARIAPSLQLQIEDSGGSIVIDFEELDDFHPDNLYRRLDVFQGLRRLRKRLMDPQTFAEAAAELRKDLPAFGGGAVQSIGDSSLKQGATDAEAEGDMVERLLGKPSDGTVTSSLGASEVKQQDFDTFIRHLVSPHLSAGVDDRQQSYVSSVDDSISSLMRRILRDPAFQALESSWRSLYRVISQLETGEELVLYMLDLPKSGLQQVLSASSGELEDSCLYKLLMAEDAVLGDAPWSLLAGDYSFAATEVDVSLLTAMGAIASCAGGPFMASADLALIGCESAAQAASPESWQVQDQDCAKRWSEFRQEPWAAWVGLALPRILIRLPYGRDSDEIDSFEFEEVPVPDKDMNAYLWGSPAYAITQLLAHSHQSRGWSLPRGDQLLVDDLPAYTYTGDDGAELLPCTEVSFSERATAKVQAAGLMPLLSFRGRNAARVFSVHSLADSDSALAGPWQ